MDPITGAALITAGASIVSNILGGSSTSKTNKANILMTRETNANNRAIADAYNQNQLALAKYQYQTNLEQWNRENQYNSAAAIMKRYKEAGLNPNLIYGAASGSNLAGSSPQMEVPSQQMAQERAPHISPYNYDFSGLSTVGDYFYNKKSIEAQIENKQADTLYKKAQAKEAGVRTDTLSFEYQKAQELYNDGTWRRQINNELGIQEKTIGKLNQEIEQSQQWIKESMSRQGLNEKEVEVKAAMIKEIQAQTTYWVDENKRKWKLTDAQVKELGALAGYYVAQTKQINELTPELVGKLKQEIVNLQDDHKLFGVKYTGQVLSNTYQKLKNYNQSQRNEYNDNVVNYGRGDSFGSWLSNMYQRLPLVKSPNMQ